MVVRNRNAPVVVAGPRRVMAGLAAVYGAYVGVVVCWGFHTFDPLLLSVFAVSAVILALPAALARPTRFNGACYAMAALVLVVGCWLAIGGLFLLYPAVLPLLLATTTLPMARHPWPVVITAALLAVAPPIFFALVS
ncbi:hypothetical protein [Actinoplanes flavus]|uniref:Uncharacterized protein n=1 Tax=Actinoplanes flavus TaxID=2820290 RepID=A0ABS3V0N4_9ACTN|nr:hypothetical protein [Actinoplanes flavus]MBO3744393.1 hypothetical protein [Actinoplanes flavus]